LPPLEAGGAALTPAAAALTEWMGTAVDAQEPRGARLVVYAHIHVALALRAHAHFQCATLVRHTLAAAAVVNDNTADASSTAPLLPPTPLLTVLAAEAHTALAEDTASSEVLRVGGQMDEDACAALAAMGRSALGAPAGWATGGKLLLEYLKCVHPSGLEVAAGGAAVDASAGAAGCAVGDADGAQKAAAAAKAAVRLAKWLQRLQPAAAQLARALAELLPRGGGCGGGVHIDANKRMSLAASRSQMCCKLSEILCMVRAEPAYRFGGAAHQQPSVVPGLPHEYRHELFKHMLGNNLRGDSQPSQMAT
tara:strand:- start:480 stop:1403 length:924 start_codon:yes stop_codon:yes gene_type:complete